MQWHDARSHHERALQLYVTTYVDPLASSAEGAEGEEPGAIPETALIYTDHEDGGLFMAHFSRPNEHHYRYVDEYDNTVDIMMAEPAIVSHINRITD